MTAATRGRTARLRAATSSGAAPRASRSRTMTRPETCTSCGRTPPITTRG
jgi:hypothetical protein